MHLLKYLINLALIILISNCTIQNGSMSTIVIGNGKISKDVRTLPIFDKIVVSGSIDLVIENQSEQSVSIEADSNLFSIIKTECKDGVLHLYTDKSYSTKSKLILRATIKNLSSIEINGSSDAIIRNLNNQILSLHINGSGNISVTGKSNVLNAHVSGSGNIDAKELETNDANIEISGSGDAKVNSNNSLNINIAGSGDVVYFGEPKKVNNNIAGSGSITKG